MDCYVERIEKEQIILHIGTILMAGDSAFKEFEVNLHSLIKQNFKRVIIDFSECIYIDSHAISAIISANRRLKNSGTQLKIQNMNRDISELFHAIQLNRIIEMVESDYS